MTWRRPVGAPRPIAGDDRATTAVLAALEDAHAIVLQIEHDAGGTSVALKDSPAIVALPLSPDPDPYVAA